MALEGLALVSLQSTSLLLVKNKDSGFFFKDVTSPQICAFMSAP
jgi:hypothetical protein